MLDDISYYQWNTTKKSITVQGVEMLLKLFTESLPKLMKHEANHRHQYQVLTQLKNNPSDDKMVLHIDFSENYACKLNAQSFYFGGSHRQVTFHTGMICKPNKQASEGQHCDIQSLSLCTSREHYLSDVILESFFRPMERKHCHFAIDTIFNLKLKPLGYMEDYRKLAGCLDKSSPHVSECIPKKWVATNAVIDAHFERKLCRYET
ncbi:hypothetical protein AVEN_44315-1 [Araneus ventricosus]|uniref:Uncharacterized protein n=1 Tax=Araneus ventricosus TaxID=182803 RepID=A0A4Y2DR83_ARAVE|nr:hypothetical protein AVEN_44315-1 [Araneus ventricosus]